jgi:hypothetical protein
VAAGSLQSCLDSRVRGNDDGILKNKIRMKSVGSPPNLSHSRTGETPVLLVEVAIARFS